MFDEQLGKTVISRDVQFDECNSRMQQQILEDDVMEENGEDNSNTKNVNGVNPVGDKDSVPVPTRKSQRQRKSPDRYGEWVTTTVEESDCPKSHKEAVQHHHQSPWESAMKDEMNSMKTNDVWELVPRPPDRKVIGSKWIFKVKMDANGTIERYKARLVSQGCTQKYGTDYDETFSPVIRAETVRTILAISAQKGLIVHQMDVATVFLNGELKGSLYDSARGICSR